MIDNFNALEKQPSYGGKIEGGVDAIVVGASIDGLIAAAYLGRAGLKTVLLEAGLPQPELRPFAPGYFADDGDFLVRDLDPEMINALDLYRHGLSYVQRRFDTVYYFGDQSTLHLDGDLFRSFESIVEIDKDDAAVFQSFVEEMLQAARELRPFFCGAPMPSVSKSTLRIFNNFAMASLDQVLDASFQNARLKNILVAEASLLSALKPSDPYSFLSLLRRWSGEAAGLQAACALPSGGYTGLFDALRRSVQSSNVEIRTGGSVQSLLVEWDNAAGVEMRDGGQIRAPIVINALNSNKVFLDQIGADTINIEFQKSLTYRTPKVAPVKVHFALNGIPRDGKTRLNLSRRLVFTPDQQQLRKAYRMAHEGEVAPQLLMELVFPSMFEEGWAPPNGNFGSGWIHPVPFQHDDENQLRAEIKSAAVNTLEKIAPGARERLESVEVVLLSDLAARFNLNPNSFFQTDAVLTKAHRAQMLRTASGIEGVFFCGPESQVGFGVNGAAGRTAGKAAIQFSRSRKGTT